MEGRNDMAGLRRRALRWLVIAAGGVAAVANAGSAFAAGTSLSPHRAVYAMKMISSTEGSDISSVTGKLVLEWQGSACEGWVTNQRIVNRMGSKQGSSFVSDFRVSSWEAGDGSDYTFSMIHYVNGETIEEIEGSAVRREDKSLATLSKPEDGTIALPDGVVFPTEQISRMLDAAYAGRTVFAVPVFDGSDTEHYFDTTAILGGRKKGAPQGEEARAGKSLEGLAHWPVQVSYFNPGDSTGLPDYEVSFQVYENGVSTGLVMDYGDLVLGADLMDLTMLPVPECN